MAGLLSPRYLVVRHRKKPIFVSLLVLAAAACIRELWIWPEREGHFAATVGGAKRCISGSPSHGVGTTRPNQQFPAISTLCTR